MSKRYPPRDYSAIFYLLELYNFGNIPMQYYASVKAMAKDSWHWRKKYKIKLLTVNTKHGKYPVSFSVRSSTG